MTSPLLTFVHISDTHISANPEYGLQHSPYSTQTGAQALVKAVNNLPFPVDLVLHTGDVAYDPDPSAYETARQIFSSLKFPIRYLAGNHDYPRELQRILLGRADAAAPFHYTFEMNGVQFICLDSNGPAEPPRGNVISEQLAWLEALLITPDDRPLVVAIHHNALPVGSPWLDEYMRIVNGETLHQVLLKAKDRLRGVFFGHVHQNLQMYQDGILYTSALSSWNQFYVWPGLEETIQAPDGPGFNVVTISANQTFVRRWYYSV